MRNHIQELKMFVFIHEVLKIECNVELYSCFFRKLFLANRKYEINFKKIFPK